MFVHTSILSYLLALRYLCGVALSKGLDPYGVMTVATVRVDRVIWGDAKVGSEIKLLQPGRAHTTESQTKVEGEKTMIMMLRPADAEGEYYSGGAEMGLFYLADSAKVTSMSDFMLCARYDERSKGLLERDLVEALERKDTAKAAR